MNFKNLTLTAVLGTVILLGCNPKQQTETGSVKEVMDDFVTKLYSELDSAQLDTLREDYILNKLSEKDKVVLSTNYWTFEVDVPVTVSLMRDMDQKVVPFWFTKSGFKKTDMVVKNELSTYEVWQKNFEKGAIGLGINGFDKHRPVYFISVGAQKPTEQVTISNMVPAQYGLEEMKKGAFVYHDWDSLILTEMPESLVGQKLFTTVRGRAREAHIVGAFRKTISPSTELPDQILQTWSADPKTTLDIQWRTKLTVKDGLVKYWQQNQSDTLEQKASVYEMEDRLLQNDRYVNRFTANLSNLKPGETYFYKVGSTNGKWSKEANFKTESAKNDGFSYIWFGDTHYSPVWGDMIQKAFKRHPESAFYSIAGDLVSTGLHRNEWDEFFQYSGNVFQHKPLMPVPGNHDSQDGLGAWMYQELFSFPKNGPTEESEERTYSFEYQNALYLQIDATLPNDDQTAWIEKTLKESKATWKFVMFHFPPYNFVEPYDEIRAEWCSLFDKYHVDMVMSGHMHYYLRTKPMFAGKEVSDPSKGTIYLMSISIPGKQDEWLPEDYAVVRYPDGPLYQHMAIKGNTLTYRSLDPAGNLKDELIIKK